MFRATECDTCLFSFRTQNQNDGRLHKGKLPFHFGTDRRYEFGSELKEIDRSNRELIWMKRLSSSRQSIFCCGHLFFCFVSMLFPYRSPKQIANWIRSHKQKRKHIQLIHRIFSFLLLFCMLYIFYCLQFLALSLLSVTCDVSFSAFRFSHIAPRITTKWIHNKIHIAKWQWQFKFSRFFYR